MIKKIMATSVVVGSMFAFVGCGSDNDTPVAAAVETGTSYYIDSAVSGVNYTCGSEEGITGTDGSFTFEVGASCTFYLGDIELRSVAVEELVDGESIVETDVAIARILQSLDSDGNPDNGITIDAEIIEAIVAAGITTLPDTVEELAIFEEVLLANDLTIVTLEEAQAHLDETVSQFLLAGKTFFVVGQSVSDATDIWGGEATFNANLTELTITEGGASEIVPISIDGDRLVFEDDTDGSYSIIGDDKGDYIEFIDYYSNGTIEGNSRLYYEEAKADTYLETISGASTVPPVQIEITEAMLNGKTFYDRDFGDNGDYGFGKMTMTDTEFTRSEIWYDANGNVIIDGSESPDGISTFTLPYELVDGKIRVDVSVFNEGYFWFGLLSENVDSWDMKKAQDLDKDGFTEDSSEGTSTWYLSPLADSPF